MLKKHIIIFMLTAIIILAGGVCVFGKIFAPPGAEDAKPINELQETQPLLSLDASQMLDIDKMDNIKEPKIIDENGWTIYKNYFYKTQFSIPPNFAPDTETHLGFIAKEKNANGVKSRIIYQIVSDERDLERYKYNDYPFVLKGEITSPRETIMAGQKVVVYGRTGWPEPIDFYGEKIWHSPARVTWIKKDKVCHVIILYTDEKNIDEVFDKIISSFKFTN